VSRPRGTLRRLQRRWKDSWIADPDGAGTQRAKTIDMLFFDHGLLRKAWRNEHQIYAGVWRSSQPDPSMIRRLAAQGVRAIINLRGATEWGSYFLEREACAAAGIELVDFKLNSRTLPSRKQLRDLAALFRRLPRPFLMHCKSGADRAGFAAALYLLLEAKSPVDEAKRQLSWRYLHLRGSATGVLRFLLDRYAADNEREPMAFRDWVERRYDPEALMRDYKADPAASFLVDNLLRRE